MIAKNVLKKTWFWRGIFTCFLLYAIYRETGIFTTIFLFLNYLGFEFMVCFLGYMVEELKRIKMKGDYLWRK